MEEKALKNLQKVKEKCREYRDKKLTEKQEKTKVVYTARRDKDVARRVKKSKESRDKKIKNAKREIKWHKQVNYKKKDKTLAWYKSRACTDYQWCVRFDAQDENGYVKTIDGKVRAWDSCDAGHLFAKSRFKHMIFVKDNCFPQSKRSNKELWQTTWLQFKDAVIERIGEKRWDDLVKLSKDKNAHNKLRNKQYWKDKFLYRHKQRLLKSKK